jgi:sec-independent protein translocase protein TatB
MLVILLVALIVLGPHRLPDAARQAGRALAEFRRITSGFQDELRDALQVEESRPVERPDVAVADSPVEATNGPTPSSNGWRRVGLAAPEEGAANESPPDS